MTDTDQIIALISARVPELGADDLRWLEGRLAVDSEVVPAGNIERIAESLDAITPRLDGFEQRLAESEAAKCPLRDPDGWRLH
jgi:hypothetical protein